MVNSDSWSVFNSLETTAVCQHYVYMVWFAYSAAGFLLAISTLAAEANCTSYKQCPETPKDLCYFLPSFIFLHNTSLNIFELEVIQYTRRYDERQFPVVPFALFDVPRKSFESVVPLPHHAKSRKSLSCCSATEFSATCRARTWNMNARLSFRHSLVWIHL